MYICQGWQRAASVYYPLRSLPVLSYGLRVPNIQAEAEHGLQLSRPAAASGPGYYSSGHGESAATIGPSLPGRLCCRSR